MRTAPPPGSRRVADWVGRRVRSRVLLGNGIGSCPPGTVFTVTDARGGLSLEAEPCATCRTQFRIRRVSPSQVDLVDEAPACGPTARVLACEDCGTPYAAFPLDVVLPDPDWLAIHPTGFGGVLCARCIVARAATLPTMIVVYARLVPEADHDAFRVVKNHPLPALAAAVQARSTEPEATAFLDEQDAAATR